MRPADRTEYIVQCLREAGSMYEDGARAFLAEHDARCRAEALTALAEKLDGRLKLTAHKTVSKDAIRRFLELEASAARAAINTETAPAAPAPDPEVAADTTRRAQLLYAMAAQGGHWKSGTVVRWYKANGYQGLGIPAARRDLATLRDRGHIHQHDNAGCRFFTTSLTTTGEDVRP
ncbi:hypothetical protein ACIQFU_22855 [Streptomyces sp. NPDC093065]|uniref:hypothetical protein n=1 Tax=Streptomyces sp. NPDC093065 TaxID=3366021 RepID=UPI0037F9A13C